MKKRTSLIPILILSLFTSNIGQTPAPQQNTPNDDDDVVRITTNLVQIDAVITDKSGKLVTDLRPEDVEITEDGRPQKITNFSFVSTVSGTAQPIALKSGAPVDKNAPPAPPVRLKPEQVQRTIALVIDDLGLSFESMHIVRQGLKKFVDQQVQPGDLVAIIRTAGGMGALQGFTSDKRQLYAAIERVRWNPNGRGSIMAVEEAMPDPLAEARAKMPESGDSSGVKPPSNEVNQLREDRFVTGALGTINYVVRGMRELPGRKSIVLMSDGISIFIQGDDSSRRERLLESLRRLTDLANRASVVIYTMDARGLQTLPLEPEGWVTNPTQGAMAMQKRRGDFFESQNGLNYLAQQTGGFFIRNDNNLGEGIKRVLDDQKGYYLIGYRPDESTFNPVTGRRTFHKVALKLKRPGLNHRTRTGFYGITDEQAATPARTRVAQLSNALRSPFASGGVRLRLTSLYGNDPKAGSFVHSMLHVEGRDLTFIDEPDGWHKAVFDVVAVTFDANGAVLDEVNRIQTVRVRGETYKSVLENGFIYTLTVPVKKPGAYQLRAALRDTKSERVGSASQFIEIPNIAKNRLTLSGIVVKGTDPSAKPGAMNKAPGGSASAPPDAQTQAAEEEITDIDPQASPAVRRFRRGMLMSFDFVIYNATVDKATATPRLQTQIRLFRDGKEIFAGRVQSLDARGQPDLKRLTAGGALQLGVEMTPGEYILQVIVTDPLAKDKYRMATQWIDFEIVK